MVETNTRDDTRHRIVEAAARLLAENGPGAVTTRAVADAAGVQAPTLYRLLGDKDGLMEAVAEHVLAAFVASKESTVEAATVADVDPVDELRSGWEAQIEFSLANPGLFGLLSDPARGLRSPAVRSGVDVLRARVHRIALAGRLRVSEHRAVDVIRSCGQGLIITILATPPDERDPGLSDTVWAAVLGQILTDAPGPDAGGATATLVALRALAPDLDALTGAERTLLLEWLDRAIRADAEA